MVEPGAIGQHNRTGLDFLRMNTHVSCMHLQEAADDVALQHLMFFFRHCVESFRMTLNDLFTIGVL